MPKATLLVQWLADGLVDPPGNAAPYLAANLALLASLSRLFFPSNSRFSCCRADGAPTWTFTPMVLTCLGRCPALVPFVACIRRTEYFLPELCICRNCAAFARIRTSFVLRHTSVSKIRQGER